jgi:transposase
MPAKLYHVNLTVEERQELLELTSKGRINARKMKRAQVLLKADEGLKDEDIMAAVGVSRPMVERTRKRLVEGGLNKALNEDPRPGAKRRLDGRAEAHLIALTCSEPPDEHDHWALRLLADKLVELGVVESVSYETVRQTLKKMS